MIVYQWLGNLSVKSVKILFNCLIFKGNYTASLPNQQCISQSRFSFILATGYRRCQRFFLYLILTVKCEALRKKMFHCMDGSGSDSPLLLNKAQDICATFHLKIHFLDCKNACIKCRQWRNKKPPSHDVFKCCWKVHLSAIQGKNWNQVFFTTKPKWIPKIVYLKRIAMHKECKCKEVSSPMMLGGEICLSDVKL